MVLIFSFTVILRKKKQISQKCWTITLKVWWIFLSTVTETIITAYCTILNINYNLHERVINKQHVTSSSLTPLSAYCLGVHEVTDTYIHREHSREAAGLKDLVVGNVLLQIADVSASSTSCCQWLKQNKRVRVSNCNERHLVWKHPFLPPSLSFKTPVSIASPVWRRERSSFKSYLLKHMTEFLHAYFQRVHIQHSKNTLI